MSNKRYYWLKLSENFFEDDTIEWIEEQENGERYVLFYLKLCLRSLKDEGNLIRYVGEKLIPYDVKSLAKLTNTDQDTVAVSLRVFEEIGLIERTDAGEIYMKQIDEMIGTETDSARRMRKARARKSSLPSHCANKVLESDTSVQKSDTEIEIEIDKELDKEQQQESEETKKSGGSSETIKPYTEEEFKEIAKLYQVCIGQPNGLTADWIDNHLEEYGFEWLKNALLITEEQGKRSKAYVNSILNNWKTSGGMKLGGKKDGGSNGNSEADREELEGEGERLFKRAVEKYDLTPIPDEDIDF